MNFSNLSSTLKYFKKAPNKETAKIDDEIKLVKGDTVLIHENTILNLINQLIYQKELPSNNQLHYTLNKCVLALRDLSQEQKLDSQGEKLNTDIIEIIESFSRTVLNKNKNHLLQKLFKYVQLEWDSYIQENYNIYSSRNTSQTVRNYKKAKRRQHLLKKKRKKLKDKKSGEMINPDGTKAEYLGTNESFMNVVHVVWVILRSRTFRAILGDVLDLFEKYLIDNTLEVDGGDDGYEVSDIVRERLNEKLSGLNGGIKVKKLMNEKELQQRRDNLLKDVAKIIGEICSDPLYLIAFEKILDEINHLSNEENIEKRNEDEGYPLIKDSVLEFLCMFVDDETINSFSQKYKDLHNAITNDKLVKQWLNSVEKFIRFSIKNGDNVSKLMEEYVDSIEEPYLKKFHQKRHKRVRSDAIVFQWFEDIIDQSFRIFFVESRDGLQQSYVKQLKSTVFDLKNIFEGISKDRDMVDIEYAIKQFILDFCFEGDTGISNRENYYERVREGYEKFEPDLFVMKHSLEQIKLMVAPLLKKQLEHVPLSKFSISNEKFDFEMENVVLFAKDILPDSFDLTMKEHLKLNLDELDTKRVEFSVNLHVEDVKVAFYNLNFYYSRKVFPKIKNTGVFDLLMNRGDGISLDIDWSFNIDYERRKEWILRRRNQRNKHRDNEFESVLLEIESIDEWLSIQLNDVKCIIDKMDIEIQSTEKRKEIDKLLCKLMKKGWKKDVENYIESHVSEAFKSLNTKIFEMVVSRQQKLNENIEKEIEKEKNDSPLVSKSETKRKKDTVNRKVKIKEVREQMSPFAYSILNISNNKMKRWYRKLRKRRVQRRKEKQLVLEKQFNEIVSSIP